MQYIHTWHGVALCQTYLRTRAYPVTILLLNDYYIPFTHDSDPIALTHYLWHSYSKLSQLYCTLLQSSVSSFSFLIICYDFPLDSYLYSYAQPSTVMGSLPQSWTAFHSHGQHSTVMWSIPQSCAAFHSHVQHSTVMCSLPQWILSQPNLILTHPLVPPDLCLFLLDYTTPAYSLLITHWYLYKP